MFQLLSESLYKKVLIPLTVHVCGSCIKISNLFIWTNFFIMSNLHGYYPLGKAMSSLQFLLSISKRLVFAFECDYDIDLVKLSISKWLIFPVQVLLGSDSHVMAWNPALSIYRFLQTKLFLLKYYLFQNQHIDIDICPIFNQYLPIFFRCLPNICPIFPQHLPNICPIFCPIFGLCRCEYARYLSSREDIFFKDIFRF